MNDSAPHASTRPAETSQLQAQHLMKAYNGRVVVKDVSMEVSSGQVVGLLGRNGAGKTTCFYMIAGLVPTDGGTILLDGQSISHLPIHRRARLACRICRRKPRCSAS